jgi:hypothetical protein
MASDFVRLMHLPLPLFVLAFATIGASLSEQVDLRLLTLTYAGILLALCLGAYSLDELHGRPYHTRFSDRTLKLMAGTGIFGASIIAADLALTVSPFILIFTALACFFIFSYNLELFHGSFHSAVWFGVSWGGIPTLGGYFVQAVNVSISSLLVSAMASVFSVGILLLTHKLRSKELLKKQDETAQGPELLQLSRQARRIAWTIVKIECCAVVLLAAGLIIPKFI